MVSKMERFCERQFRYEENRHVKKNPNFLNFESELTRGVDKSDWHCQIGENKLSYRNKIDVYSGYYLHSLLIYKAKHTHVDNSFFRNHVLDSMSDILKYDNHEDVFMRLSNFLLVVFEGLNFDFFRNSCDKYSALNFLKYSEDLFVFYSERKCDLVLDENGILTMRLLSSRSAYLSLTFERNGKVSFVSLDKEYDPAEKKTYVMRGTIETSNLSKNSYKIKRLLSVLNFFDMESVKNG